MALTRLLLLYVFATEVLDAETRPIDFVCDRESRRGINTVVAMEAALADCYALSTLPFPVQLPCIKVHKASWDNKSHQEKQGDIMASLGALAEGVRSVRLVRILPGCASSLLERLEHSINNYLHILTHLESSQSMKTVLWTYSRLITGKLEWLMSDLIDRCPPLGQK
ncbi:thrombopoietin isoform X3 [Osmerus eperlanus]|uniref:thrombopoietin isoform X3 n=1 Tax=Osmerus eperlanus TaxID=29151 RepID=UPI002E10598E